MNTLKGCHCPLVLKHTCFMIYWPVREENEQKFKEIELDQAKRENCYFVNVPVSLQLNTDKEVLKRKKRRKDLNIFLPMNSGMEVAEQ